MMDLLCDIIEAVAAENQHCRLAFGSCLTIYLIIALETMFVKADDKDSFAVFLYSCFQRKEAMARPL
jgi:hypothetical protein